MSDHYSVLGIAKNTEQSEIKKAFYKLSLKYHPDKYKGNSPDKNVQERYQKIVKAYEILGDADKRKAYDMYGDKAEEHFRNPFGQGGGDNPFSNGGFQDIFERMFTQHRGGGGGGPANPPKIDQTISINVKLSFAEAYTGLTKTVSIKRQVMCKDCSGRGTPSTEYIDNCNKCQGQGVYMESRRINQFTFQQSQHVCDLCKGKGSSIRSGKECKTCKNGNGYTEETEMTEIPIPKGVDNGFQLMFGGQGHKMYSKPGDLIIVTTIDPPPKDWSRSQNDIKIDYHIPLGDALFGFKKTLIHLDKRRIQLEHSGTLQSHTTKKIIGEGFKNIREESYGNLFVRFIVDYDIKTYNIDILKTALKYVESPNDDSADKSIKLV
jgi:DnaJ-class molecular chaperone